MTYDEIRHMEAGREMDYLVAEKVMKWERDPEVPYFDMRGIDDELIHVSIKWSPSTDIYAAWEVVEKFKRREMNLVWVQAEPAFYTCVFGDYARGHGDTAPLAICRAALLAANTESS